jgi:hypothetical protein
MTERERRDTQNHLSISHFYFFFIFQNVFLAFCLGVCVWFVNNWYFGMEILRKELRGQKEEQLVLANGLAQFANVTMVNNLGECVCVWGLEFGGSEERVFFFCLCVSLSLCLFQNVVWGFGHRS